MTTNQYYFLSHPSQFISPGGATKRVRKVKIQRS